MVYMVDASAAANPFRYELALRHSAKVVGDVCGQSPPRRASNVAKVGWLADSHCLFYVPLDGSVVRKISLYMVVDFPIPYKASPFLPSPAGVSCGADCASSWSGFSVDPARWLAADNGCEIPLNG